ncbi:MAG: RsbRD N-terminal domain-containing protein [Acidobacteriia bacterium]|nr:RsbRD N-terminal domain-containing protein [Terriglobia bacterium]
MASSDDLVEQWLAQTLESFPHLSAKFLASEKDRFRNPVGHALHTSMAVLLQEVLGNMDAGNIAPALDAIVRIRVVQDFTPSQAVGFVFLLRPIVRGSNPARPAMIEARIDQLALMAFDRYMLCREQIAEIRANEARRRLRVRPALRHP